MADFPLTTQQLAIIDTIETGSTHVVIGARAGTAKTFMAVKSAQHCLGKTGLVAFNRHIASELRERLNGAAKACTMHALGKAAVCKAFPRLGGAEPDELKPKKHLERIVPDWFAKAANGRLRPLPSALACLELTRLARCTLTDERDSAALAGLAGTYSIDMPDGGMDRQEVYTGCALLIEALAGDTCTYDFEDMIWLPVRLGLAVERFNTLFVDEAQDLNRCQQELALLAIAGDGRLVPVGDELQSLYSFSGADPEALPRLSARLAGSTRQAVRCPLTVTFRCPTSHVELARHLVPDLEARPGAPEGVVRHCDPCNIPSEVVPGDMVISRRNAPLISLAFKLIGRNVPVLVRGRDIGRGLLDLIEQLKPESPFHLVAELHLYEEREYEKLERKEAPESAFQSLADRTACLRELASGASSLGSLRDTIASLFRDDLPEGKVLLSSVHRAKGLESERVFIIDTENLPMIKTCRACKGRGCERCGNRGTRSKPHEIQTERNIVYVAVTRAKSELVFAGPMPAILGGDW